MSSNIYERLTELERRVALLENRVSAENKSLMRIEDICERFDISRQTWHRWVRAQIAPQPVFNMPGHPRWRVAEIDRFERGRQSSGRQR